MSDIIEGDEAAYWRSQWDLAPGVSYLNHGSFGPPPRPVQAARRVWQDQLDAQPMDFFMRRFHVLVVARAGIPRGIDALEVVVGKIPVARVLRRGDDSGDDIRELAVADHQADRSRLAPLAGANRSAGVP